MVTHTNNVIDLFTDDNNQRVTSKKRVLWLANYPLLNNHQGHPASWMTELASVIREEVELSIVTWSSAISEDIVTYKDGVHYVYLKSPRGSIDLLTFCQLKINRLRRYLRQYIHNYDLVHIHGSENQFLVACAPFTIPKVLSVQGVISEYYKILPEIISYRRIYWLLAGYYERKYGRKLPNFLCRTHWDTKWVNDLNRSAHVYPIWEMIRPDFFIQEADFSSNINILYVGGMQVIKGFYELLAALNLIKREYPEVKLIILGKKPDNLSSVARIINKRMLTNISLSDLDFRGMQDGTGLIKAYNESFCLVHPSYIDNSPNSVCEAQIAGLPVIASDVGGVSSLIEHNQTGLLTSLEPASIATQIIRLKTEFGLAKKLADQAKKVSRERHNPYRIQAEMLDAYRLICMNNQTKTVV